MKIFEGNLVHSLSSMEVDNITEQIGERSVLNKPLN